MKDLNDNFKKWFSIVPIENLSFLKSLQINLKNELGIDDLEKLHQKIKIDEINNKESNVTEI